MDNSFVPSFIKIIQPRDPNPQTSAEKINMKICCKVGPPTFTHLPQRPINYYKIQDQYENFTICNKFSRDLGYSQNVVLLLRPIVIRSNIDELILNIFRLNNFIIIKRVTRFLNDKEVTSFPSLPSSVYFVFADLFFFIFIGWSQNRNFPQIKYLAKMEGIEDGE